MFLRSHIILVVSTVKLYRTPTEPLQNSYRTSTEPAKTSYCHLHKQIHLVLLIGSVTKLLLRISINRDDSTESFYIVVHIMPRRFARTCPLCGRPGLINLSTHLLQVHLETNKERELLLKQAKVSSWQPSLPSTSNRMEPQEHSRPKKSPLPADPLKTANKPKFIQMSMLSTKPYPDFAFRHKFSLHLQNDHILYEEEKQRRVLWCYSQWQDKYDEMKRMLGPDISFVCGIPELSDDLSEINTSYNNLIILDDLMIEAKESPIVARLFTQGRHRNASIVLLLQNMFPKGKCNTVSAVMLSTLPCFEVRVIGNKLA